MFIKKRKIIDSHLHIGHWGTRKLFGQEVTPLIEPHSNFYRVGQEHNNYLDILNYFDKYEIESGIIVANYLCTDPKYSLIDLNKLVIESVKKSERIYGGIFLSPIYEDKNYTLEAIKYIKLEPRKIKVIKLTPTHWKNFSPDPNTWDKNTTKIMEKILSAALDDNMVVQFHTGGLNSEPLFFNNFFKQYGREIKIHLVHSGESCYPGMQFINLIRKWLDSGFKVYSDTSLVPGFVIGSLVDKLNREDLSRVLFATDAPWGSFYPEYWKIEGLEIMDSIKDDFFYNNAKKLYSI